MSLDTTLQAPTHNWRTWITFAVSVFAAGVIGAVLALAIDNGSHQARSAPTEATVASLAIPPTGYLDAIRSADPAPFGSAVIPMTGYLKALTSPTSADANAAVLALLTPSERHHVQAITAMTPAQLKAAFGQQTFDANAAVLASLTPSERQHVQAITAMTPAQLKAAFGTSGK